MSKPTECSNLIVTAKIKKNTAEKLNNPVIAPIAHWSILKKFLGERKALIFHL